MSSHSSLSAPLDEREREIVLRIFSAAAFFIVFQAYLVAPLIPALAGEFKTSTQYVGLAVPAYMIPYGVATLFYGPVSDRMGRKKILLALLVIVALATALTATAQSASQLLLWRLIGGVASGGVIPISLALLADLFAYNERGRPIGWIFGAIAGGMAFGSTFGAMLNPLLGWRVLFLIIAAAIAGIFAFAWPHRRLLEGSRSLHPPHVNVILKDYLTLLTSSRGVRVYGYIFINAIFHSGIFSWLGLYFSLRYRLSDLGIGLALLGYGIPGMLLGPMIGQAADRLGRRTIIPAGFLVAAVSAGLLIPGFPLIVPALMVTCLSLGYDMSHPLLAGIVTSLDPTRRGQALALNAFFLFTGFGIGSLIFQRLLTAENLFTPALAIFAAIQLVAGLVGFFLFRRENPANSAHT